jgi:hypothetical protein
MSFAQAMLMFVEVDIELLVGVGDLREAHRLHVVQRPQRLARIDANRLLALSRHLGEARLLPHAADDRLDLLVDFRGSDRRRLHCGGVPV